MIGEGATRHLGLDLGGTNLKWAVVEHEARHLDCRSPTTRSRRPGRPTPTSTPDAVTRQLGEVALRGHRRRTARSPASGSGCRACTTRRRAGRGSWSTSRVRGPAIRSAGPVGDATGVPTHLVNDARAFGLAELRLGAGRGASSMIGLTLGHRGRRRLRGRRAGPPGPRRHGGRDGPPDDRPGRRRGAAAATGAASRRSRARTRSRRRAAPRRPRRRSRRRGRATSAPDRRAAPTSGATSGSGSPT